MKSRRKGKGVLWSQNEARLLAKLWRDGVSVKEICTIMGRSLQSVNRKTARLELTRRHPSFSVGFRKPRSKAVLYWMISRIDEALRRAA
jgi:hypothetical protein